MTKPLFVTSTTHVAALWGYGILAGLGFTLVIGVTHPDSIYALLHWTALVRLWALVWFAGGAVGLFAAFAAARVRDSDMAAKAARVSGWLKVEMYGCIALVVAVVVFEISAVPAVTSLKDAAAQVLLVGYLGSSAHRIRQIVRERPLLDRAAASTATAEVAADPDDPDGT